MDRTMVTMLVSYWVEYDNDKFLPGDATIATECFPATDLDIQSLREEIERTVQMKWGRRRITQIVFSNVVKLGQ
jgi:hypothetical protein